MDMGSSYTVVLGSPAVYACYSRFSSCSGAFLLQSTTGGRLFLSGPAKELLLRCMHGRLLLFSISPLYLLVCF
ncbi:hypothetical protein Bca4012_060999 [Brassica carinata]